MREARQVVAQADSLRAEGGMYSDSVTLAQAYESLYSFRYLYPTDFAHSCYHYGRLLREKENPVAAMECFIRATHSRTRDYHILGRVYSNMGDICHLANEFPLAYYMYEKSADMYMRNGDTLLYYYDLNNMAFELAEQGKKDETMALLSTIESHCKDRDVLVKSLETKAEMYFVAEKYDSAIFSANLLQSYGNHEPTGYVIKAQAFDKLGMTDSALYIADYILKMHVSSLDKYNMLYITSHYDSIDGEEILTQTSERADIGIKIDNQHSKHAQASEVLRQSLIKIPELRRWLFRIIIFIIILAAIIFPYVIHRYKSHITTKLADKQAANIVESIRKHINKTNLNQTLQWKDYNTMKSEVDLYMGGLASKLEACNLNETEIRFCILSLLDFRQKEIADTIHYSYPSGIKTLKKRIADKLKTTPSGLKDFLLRKM
ncbi:MAG: hypothetical protein IJ920_01500 [Paludibacteraceae bacterium]|nr:hypothetical protein [Paludibacteraceae bacterium]